MREYEINEEFSHEGKRLKCIKCGENGCNSCFLEPKCARGLNRSSYQHYHLYCFGSNRTDRQSVKFILSNQQK